MIYNPYVLVPEFRLGSLSDALIQTGGNFAGNETDECYVPLTICNDRAKAEDLVEQIGTTVK
jgi:hypothetical protein